MVRVVKEYDDRYTEFLDTAQSLFFTKGYEATSVQQIIDMMNVSKGAFYHYFDSKTDLLEAVVLRMTEDMLPQLEIIMHDTTLSIIEKLEEFFAQLESRKLENKTLMLATVRVLYMDENVLLRSKLREKSKQMIVPLIAQIIKQGISEKIFVVEYPLATAHIILKMSEVISQSGINVLLADEITTEQIEEVRQLIIVFNHSVERILGLEKNALTLIEPDIINVWLS